MTTPTTVEAATTGSDLEALAAAYVRLWNERDRAAIPRLVAESFVMYDPVTPATGVPGPKGEVHGRDGLEAFVAYVTRAFPDFEVVPLDVLTGTDVVMYEVRLRMTHEGPLGGLPPTGRRLDLRGASVLRVEDGRIVEHRFHTDMSEAAEQLGLTFPAILGQLPKLLVGKLRPSR
jgi:steroid delta-isomerase-like uncharacterized protein